MASQLKQLLWRAVVFSLTALSAIPLIGGVVVAILGRGATTEMNVFGHKVTTTDVGVALIFLGVILAIMTFRRLFRTLDVLINSPSDLPMPKQNETVRRLAGRKPHEHLPNR